MIKIAIPYTLLFLLLTLIFLARSPNIQVDEDVTCDITLSEKMMANYIFSKYGKSGDLSEITYALYRHGYYLRNIYKNEYIYVSTHDGSKCSFSRYFTIDSLIIIAKIDENGKVYSLGD